MSERNWTLLAIACLANFFVFGALAVALGGDAINGKVEGGHYFLASHGAYTEVSETTFAYSRAHVFSLCITHPVALLAMWRAKSAQARTKKGQLSRITTG